MKDGIDKQLLWIVFTTVHYAICIFIDGMVAKTLCRVLDWDDGGISVDILNLIVQMWDTLKIDRFPSVNNVRYNLYLQGFGMRCRCVCSFCVEKVEVGKLVHGTLGTML